MGDDKRKLRNVLRLSDKHHSKVKHFDGRVRSSGDLDWSGDLQQVPMLDFTGRIDLIKLPEDIGVRAPQLMQLTLAGCEALQTLPHSLCSLTALTRLDLAGCTSLAWLPGGVQHLQALRELVLTRCSALSDLPAGVGSLPRLRVLDVGGCTRLTALPPLQSLADLTRLDVFGCERLRQLPLLGALSALRDLDITHCALLQRLPDSFGLLGALTKLSVAHCKALASLPGSLCATPGLVELDLTCCDALTALPQRVGDLTTLWRLHLAGCSTLCGLPDSICQLTGLAELDLTNCTQLRALPPQLGALSRLTRLDCHGCSRLAALPDSVTRLRRLRVLSVRECDRLERLPGELLSALAADECTDGGGGGPGDIGNREAMAGAGGTSALGVGEVTARLVVGDISKESPAITSKTPDAAWQSSPAADSIGQCEAGSIAGDVHQHSDAYYSADDHSLDGEVAPSPFQQHAMPSPAELSDTDDDVVVIEDPVSPSPAQSTEPPVLTPALQSVAADKPSGNSLPSQPSPSTPSSVGSPAPAKDSSEASKPSNPMPRGCFASPARPSHTPSDIRVGRSMSSTDAPTAQEASSDQTAEPAMLQLMMLSTDGCPKMERPPLLQQAMATLYCRQIIARHAHKQAVKIQRSSGDDRHQGAPWLDSPWSPITQRSLGKMQALRDDV